MFRVADYYDRAPYAGQSYPATHPSRLAAIATLMGMQPADPRRCRVLELGCAQGNNLIPLALAAPHSTFLGLDLSARQIAEGRELADALHLDNLRLRQQDLLDFEPEDGARFDYIICHGVWSWVAAPVRTRIFELCQRYLSPQGVAYLSYNTYPGWHLHDLTRGMMQFVSRQAAAAGPARESFERLANAMQAGASPFAPFLASQIESLRAASEAYLMHEHLEPDNVPVYFFQFHDQLLSHGLQYLGEAALHMDGPCACPPAALSVLGSLPTELVARQQTLDFLRNTRFRKSLICRGDVSVDRQPVPQRMRGLYVASAARPASQRIEIDSSAEEEFSTPEARVLTRDPFVKAILAHLALEWPRAVSLKELAGQVRRCPSLRSANTWELRDRLAAQLLHLGFSTPFLEFFVEPPPVADRVGHCPQASPLARRQAQSARRVSNLRHETVCIDAFQQQLLPYLDGEHRCEAIESALREELCRTGVSLAIHLQRLRSMALLLDPKSFAGTNPLRNRPLPADVP